ncbi:DUF2510 domain-containing protein [Leifsonia sp. AG29]|uniref:DUF2510 domain-containing protein n=1 Tax=Leifsonia sp. AG29 TaxID=2598860 RepID=UPI00131C9DD0|nr:DUF2510 domain-containing protein [Leifsonia sp. AG29]
MTELGGHAAAGWYPDPTGMQGLRWWDGLRWTAHTAPAVNPYAAPALDRRPLPATTSVNTVWIWLVVLLPLVSSLLILLLHPQLDLLASPSGRPGFVDPFALLGGPLYFVVMFANWTISAAIIVFSWLDWRELTRRGVDRPFHWAWAFLGIVYPIGRSVIVHRVAGRGRAPLWTAIAVLIATTAIMLVWMAVLSAQIAGSIATNLPSGA